MKDVEVEDAIAGVSHRITLTAPLINKARKVLFLVTGIEKSRTLETVLTGAYQPEKYPAQLIAPEQGEVLWFVDDHAATNKVMSLSVADPETDATQNKP